MKTESIYSITTTNIRNAIQTFINFRYKFMIPIRLTQITKRGVPNMPLYGE